MTNDTCECDVLPFIWGWSPCVLVSLSSFAGVLVWTHLIWENIFLEEGAVPASLLVFASLPVCMAVANNSIPCAVDFRSGMNHQWEMSTEHSERVPGRILPKKKKKKSPVCIEEKDTVVGLGLFSVCIHRTQITEENLLNALQTFKSPHHHLTAKSTHRHLITAQTNLSCSHFWKYVRFDTCTYSGGSI